MRKNWDYQLDFVRAMAAILVVMVHVFGTYYLKNSAAYYGDVLASSGIFIFVILSGYANSLRFRDTRRGPRFTFLVKKALLKLVIPYVIWSWVYYALNLKLLNQNPWAKPNFMTYLMRLWSGTNWFHLYYLVFSIYLYLSMVLIFRSVRRHQWLTTAIFAITPLIIGLIPASKNFYISTFVYLMPFNWWGILFVIGVILALKTNLKLLVRTPYWIVIILVTLASFSGYLSVNQFVTNAKITNGPWYVTMMYLRLVYAGMGFLLLYTLGAVIMKKAPIRAVFELLSKHSYTIYLAHPLFILMRDRLSLVHKMPKVKNTGDIWYEFAFVLIAATLSAVIIDTIIALPKIIKRGREHHAKA